jgi:hypothetical protein
MIRYNWQQKDWPNFTYTLQGGEDELFGQWRFALYIAIID